MKQSLCNPEKISPGSGRDAEAGRDWCGPFGCERPWPVLRRNCVGRKMDSIRVASDSINGGPVVEVDGGRPVCGAWTTLRFSVSSRFSAVSPGQTENHGKQEACRGLRLTIEFGIVAARECATHVEG